MIVSDSPAPKIHLPGEVYLLYYQKLPGRSASAEEFRVLAFRAEPGFVRWCTQFQSELRSHRGQALRDVPQQVRHFDIANWLYG
jgi:hypothetical protein